MPKIVRSLAVLLAVSVATFAHAQTVTVTVSSSAIDIDWQTGTISDLPGPDGEVSFAEALVATNNTPGHQTIAFAIPQSNWGLQFLYPGRAVIMGGNLRSFDDVTVDGRTQTAFTGDTNPNGGEVAIYGATLYLNGPNSAVYGLDSSPIQVTGANGWVEGNTGTSNITLFDGGGTTITGNIGGTIKIDRSNDNVVVGNTVQRVRVWGFGPDAPAMNNRIGGPDEANRNFLTGYGTWNSEGLPAGATVQLFETANTLIENNWIGTTPDGLSQGNLASTMGIEIQGANDDLMIRGNRIAGILGHGQGPHHAGQLFGWGIYMAGSGDRISILGNTIGLDVFDEPVLGSVTGIDIGSFYFSGSNDLQIGGPLPGDGNVIAGHLLNGVVVGRTVTGARISGNAVFGNGALGIDLIPTSYGNGVTPNDPQDADTGGNGLQNHPVIDAATSDGTNLEVSGSLDSEPLATFSIEFFVSSGCDESGFGEGQRFVGTTSVVTDEDGVADFDVLLSLAVGGGWVVTATATREPVGATSEFSACAEIVGGVVVGVADGDAAPSAGLRLLPNHPNPFRVDTRIDFELARDSNVRATIHDAMGRLVRRLLDGSRPAGFQTVRWDGRNDHGDQVAPGVYFVRLATDVEDAARRLLLVR